MLDASYEHLTPADVGEFKELLHLGDDYGFISRVKSNYLASDNVTELAGVCGYSSTITFRRRFQRVFGFSASSWLRQRRIERLIGCPPETEEWLDNEAVCRRLGISKRTLQHYRDTGKIPFSMIGHKCYYKESDITEILNAKKD